MLLLLQNDVLRNSVNGHLRYDYLSWFNQRGLCRRKKPLCRKWAKQWIGFGSAQSEPGAGRAEEAARLAIKNDLLEKVDLSNAKGILVNITSGMDLGFDEFNVVGDTVGSFASEDATIVVGTSLVPEMSNEIRVTIVATGLGDVVAAEPVVIARPQAVSTTSARFNNQ